MATDIIDDAREMFDYYVFGASRSLPRIAGMKTDGNYTYSVASMQVDTAVFAHVFTCVRQAIQMDFGKHYNSNPHAFDHLVKIVTPNANDNGLTTHCRFWYQGVNLRPVTESLVDELSRTIRNGFGHFNFRFIDVSPVEYFKRLNLPLPPYIPDPTVVSNYRVFICDHRPGKKFLKSRDADTRIVETHFAHLRYHLHRFLAAFFAKPGPGYPATYPDILTEQPTVSLSLLPESDPYPVGATGPGPMQT